MTTGQNRTLEMDRCLFPWICRKRFWGAAFAERNLKFLSWCQRLLEGILSKWEYFPWSKIIRNIISLCFSYVLPVTSRLQLSACSEIKLITLQCFRKTHWISYTIDCSKPGESEVCVNIQQLHTLCHAVLPSQNKGLVRCTGLLTTMGRKPLFATLALCW